MTLGSTQTLSKILDKLCALFDEELHRQRAVKRMCKAQGDAARASDFEAMELHTETLVVLMEDALVSEKSRIVLLHWIVEHYRLPESEHTLSDLIKIVPQPWRDRMRTFQTEIRTVLAATQTIVSGNESFMNRASQKLDDTIHLAVEHVVGKADGYSASGKESNEHRRPALLNTVG